jgi:Arc/MetJ family transcription regulator
MRTNIVINDDLMVKALKISGFTTKKLVVEEALKLFIRLKSQSRLKQLYGKLKWEGNLEQMRLR